MNITTDKKSRRIEIDVVPLKSEILFDVSELDGGDKVLCSNLSQSDAQAVIDALTEALAEIKRVAPPLGSVHEYGPGTGTEKRLVGVIGGLTPSGDAVMIRQLTGPWKGSTCAVKVDLLTLIPGLTCEVEG